MKCSTNQCENVNRGHVAAIIATNFQNNIHSTDTSLELSSPFVSRLINSCLLYARPDHTQTLLQFVFQKFQRSFKVTFVYHFVANSFTGLLAPNLQTHWLSKIKHDSLCIDAFPWRNVWSMKWRVPGQEVDQRKLEERLWKKTVRHINWTRRMPWIVKDRGSRWGMIDDHDRCEWVNVSSGTSSPGLSRTKSREP